MHAYIHLVQWLLVAHVDEHQTGGHEEFRPGVAQARLNAEMADVVDLNFFFVVFHDEAFGNEAGVGIVD